MFILVDFDDGSSKDVPVGCIQFPRKDKYTIGDRVQSRYPGLKGMFWGKVGDTNVDRQILRDQIQEGIPRIKRPIAKETKKIESDEILRDQIQEGIPRIKRPIAKETKKIESDEILRDQIQEGIPRIKRPIAKKTKKIESDEAKEAKKEANKNKRELLNERQLVQTKICKEILQDSDEQDDYMKLLLKEVKTSNKMVVAMSKAMEEQTETITSLSKKMDRMSKLLEKKSSKENRDVPMVSTPKDKIESSKGACNVLVVNEKIPNMPNTELDISTIELEAKSTTLCNSTNCINDSSLIEEEQNSSVANMDELAYVGESRFGIQMNKVKLDLCKATAKTPEKLILNILEFIINREEIQNCTLYGNLQHNKRPLDENKKYALKSQVNKSFYQGKTREEKQVEWNRLTKCINDKIRNLRKGKYKNSELVPSDI